MRRTLVLAIVVSMGVSALTACSWFDDESSGLSQALDRIAASDDARVRIAYSDTAALVRITGEDWDVDKGFAPLRAIGVDQISPYGKQAVKDTGIQILAADYVISAGAGQKAVGLISGGQKSSKVSGALTKLGWQKDGGNMVAPATTAAAPADQYSQVLAQVKVSGSDVLYGQAGASLSSAGAPSGKTLADDARIAALAECLGDVVAAQIEAVGGPNNRTAIAIGVRGSKSNEATPNAVICTAWSSKAAADRYAGLARAAVNSGKSATGTMYSELLRGALIERVGGDHNIVKLRAQTPGNVLAAFQLHARGDVPGFTR